MPSEWSKTTLAAAGVSLIDCDHRTPPAAEAGYPYIAIPQLKGGHIDLAGVRRISRAHYAEWTKKLRPEEHDVIVVRRCNSGESAVVPHGLECAIGQNLVILRADGKRVFPEFLRWLINGPEWWRQVEKFINVGAVFDSLRCRDIPNFEVLLPPLAEQQRIAEVLGALDQRISLLRQTNTTLESITKAIFKSWFIDFDPVHAKADGREPEGMDSGTSALFPGEFEESELGLIPKGWRAGRLGDVLVQRTQRTKPCAEVVALPYVPIECISSKSIFLKNFLPGEQAQSSLTLFKAGDVLFGAMRPYFHKVCIAPFDGVTRTTAFVLKPLEGFIEFALMAAFDNSTIEYATNHSEGSTIPYAKWLGSLENKPLVLPPESVSRQFSDVVTSLVAQGNVNTERSRLLAQTRDELLPRLISGKLRIPEAQEQIEDALA